MRPAPPCGRTLTGVLLHAAKDRAASFDPWHGEGTTTVTWRTRPKLEVWYAPCEEAIRHRRACSIRRTRGDGRGQSRWSATGRRGQRAAVVSRRPGRPTRRGGEDGHGHPRRDQPAGRPFSRTNAREVAHAGRHPTSRPSASPVVAAVRAGGGAVAAARWSRGRVPGRCRRGSASRGKGRLRRRAGPHPRSEETTPPVSEPSAEDHQDGKRSSMRHMRCGCALRRCPSPRMTRPTRLRHRLETRREDARRRRRPAQSVPARRAAYGQLFGARATTPTPHHGTAR